MYNVLDGVCDASRQDDVLCLDGVYWLEILVEEGCQGTAQWKIAAVRGWQIEGLQPVSMHAQARKSMLA